ncbi:MAG: site-2 protease family protein [Deinococcus sp.]|nr:site-2 protease family protein [Deinococcus sp.]
MGLLNFLLQLFNSNPLVAVLFVGGLMYSIILHEMAHAYAADKMGDKTARWLGRLSLDPRRHFDPIGALAMLLIGFGWAKPVPINPYNFRDYRKGQAIVAAAGPLTNFAIAFVLTALPVLFSINPGSALGIAIRPLIYVNLVLAAFNLIPIPPLDGSRVVKALAPRDVGAFMDRLEASFGIGLILLLSFTGVLGRVAFTLAGFLQGIIRGALAPFV